MKSLNIALVDWTMGTIIIGVFAVVCIVLVAVIYNLTHDTKKMTKDVNEQLEKSKENNIKL